MGTGSSALFWYILCVAFVGLIVSVAAGLIIYGRIVENRQRARRQARRQAAEAASGDAPPADADVPPLDPLDPRAGNR